MRLPFEIRDLHDAWRAANALPGAAEVLELPLSRLAAEPALIDDTRAALSDLTDGGFCHTVAHLLASEPLRHWLARQIGPMEARTLARFLVERMRGDDVDVGGSHALWPGMKPDDLAGWAKAHQVEFWLDVGARVLARYLPGDFPSYNHTLRTVITTDPAATQSSWDRVPLRAQRAAIALLEDMAAQVALAIAEEPEMRAARRRPGDPSLAAAYARLEALRQELRARCLPRSRADREAAEVRWSDDPPVLHYEEKVVAWCGGGFPSPRIGVYFGDATTAASVTCSCHRPRQGGCGLRLAAVDHALDLLGRDEFTTTAANIARSLAIPPWRRALDAIDGLLDLEAGQAAPWDVTEERFGWRVKSQDGLTIEPVAIRPKKRGDGWVARRLGWEALWLARRALPLPADRAVLDLASPLAEEFGRHAASLSRGAAYRAALLLAGHPRVMLKVRGVVPITVDVGELALGLDRDADGRVTLHVALGARRMRTDAALSRIEQVGIAGLVPLLDVDAARLTVARVPSALREVLQIVVERDLRLPAEAAPEILARIPSLSALMPTDVGPSLRGEAVAASTRPIVRLAMSEVDDPFGATLTVSAHLRPLPGGELVVPGEGPAFFFSQRDGCTVHVERDLEGERQHVTEVLYAANLVPGRQHRPFVWVIRQRDVALEIVAALGERPVDIEWADALPRKVSRAASADDLRVDLGRRHDWFGLRGTLQVDGASVPLSKVLEAIRARRRFVKVDDTMWVKIGDALAAGLSAPADLLEISDEGLVIPVAAARVAEQLLDAGLQVQTDTEWDVLQQRVVEAAELDPPLPGGLRAQLRDYQQRGYRWLTRLAHWSPGACLADDMGLGKTLQALALLAWRASRGPALVIAPTSVGFNWVREAARFVPDALEVTHFRKKADLSRLRALGPGDVVITSYDLVANHIERIAEIAFATVVIDEAQAIKNPGTKRARAIFGLQREFTLALTGTPLENRTGELWSLFHAITPGLLGSRQSFKGRFAVPIEKFGDTRARSALARLIGPFILRRLKSEVATQLPTLTEVRVDVDLSAGERRLYDSVLTAARRALTKKPAADDSVGKRRFQVLAALTRLRQLACHPRLYDPDSPLASAKLATLLGILEELRAEGHRALVFSQFTRHLAVVREALERDGFRYRYLDGATPASQRRAEVDAFQAGEADVFLLSLKAGGTGLNLTAASYVVHIDPWWNPAVEDQATDRAHRIGQDKPVTVYRLVARGTIEEEILALHANKRELVAALLDETTAIKPSGTLSTEELLTLLR